MNRRKGLEEPEGEEHRSFHNFVTTFFGQVAIAHINYGLMADDERELCALNAYSFWTSKIR
jgi:hypothetical protein